MTTIRRPTTARQVVSLETDTHAPTAGPFTIGESSLNSSGVGGGTYGDSTHVGQFTVGSDGRIASASDVAIAFPPSTPGGTNGQVQYNNAGVFGGFTMSIGLAMPSIFNVSGSPIGTAPGTFTVTLATETPNTVFAGDASATTGPAPTFVSSGTYVTFSNVSSVNVPYPASPIAGDYAFIYVESLNNGGVDTTSPPSGWTLVAHNGGGLVNQVLLMKKLTGSESGTVTVTFTASTGVNNWGGAFMAYYHGMPSSGTVYEGAATSGNTSGTTMTGSAVTTTGANRTVVTFWGAAQIGSGAPTSGTPAGWTNDVADSQASPKGLATWADHIVEASAGTVSAASRTLSVSSFWGAITLALIPAPATPGAPTFRALVPADIPIDGTTIVASGGVLSVPGAALPGAATVLTDESNPGSSYGNLTTTGPSVTMTTGTSVAVAISALMYRASGTGNTAFLGVAVSGATTIAAPAGGSFAAAVPAVAASYTAIGITVVITGLTAGSNTFTLQYKADGNNAQFHFANRAIAVTRLN